MPEPTSIRAKIYWRPLEKRKTAPVIMEIELPDAGGLFLLTFTPEAWSQMVLAHGQIEGTMGPAQVIIDTPKGAAV